MTPTLTDFEKFVLAQPVPELGLPEISTTDDVSLWERAWILGYGCYVPRGEENLRRLAITAGILPGSEEEISELEKVGY